MSIMSLILLQTSYQTCIVAIELVFNSYVLFKSVFKTRLYLVSTILMLQIIAEVFYCVQSWWYYYGASIVEG
jgi:hypothetical protein